jgi:hypothetical protein
MKRGLDPRDIGLEVFKTKLQLVVIEPFGAPTKLAAMQFLNDEPEAFDRRLRRSEVARSVTSVRTIRCSVSTSSGKAARSMFMSQKSTLTHTLPHRP